ncbi:MAG: type II toxin-antitoxin system VapC family toxin [Panacagrimonas sp.]
MRIVLDNSVTLGWFHPQQLTGYGEAVLSGMGHDEWLVPGHWPLELGNSLWQLERRKRMVRERRLVAINEALQLPITVLPVRFDLPRLAELAEQHDLTTYDAAYLDCAMRNNARLATQDAALKKAASALDCWFEPPKH